MRAENKKQVFLCDGDMDMMKNIKTNALASLVIIALFLTGCGARFDKEIKIGLVCSQSDISNDYPEMLTGMEFAAEDIARKYNKGEYSVSVEIFNDKGESGNSDAQAKKALGEKSIDYIAVMSNDDFIDRTGETLGDGKKVTFWLDDGGHLARGNESKNQFYLTYDLSDRATGLTNYCVKKKVKSLSVLYSAKNSNGGIGHALIEEAGSAGIDTDSQVMLNSFSFDEYKEKLKKDMPDAVAVLTDEPEENIKIIRGVKTILPNCVILTDSYMDNADFIKKNQWLMEGVVLPSRIKSDWNKNEINKISERYETLYGKEIETDWFFHGYYALMELAEATVNCKTSKADTVNKYLTRSSSGRYNFNDAGIIMCDDLSVQIVKNGELKKVSGIK